MVLVSPPMPGVGAAEVSCTVLYCTVLYYGGQQVRVVLVSPPLPGVGAAEVSWSSSRPWVRTMAAMEGYTWAARIIENMVGRVHQY